MELSSLLFLMVVCTLCFYLGHKYGQNQAAMVDAQYVQLQQLYQGDPNNDNQTSSMSNQMDKQQKDYERLTKELSDFSQKERKLVQEIKQLRQRLDDKTQTELQISDNQSQRNVDLLSDKEFDSLLDATSKDAQNTVELNEDDFDKQLNEATQ